MLYCDAIEVARDPQYAEMERAIHAFEHKKALMERRTHKISAAVMLGFMRGAIIGVILGGSDGGVIEGMVSFGSLGGILAWLSDRLAAAHG